MPRDLREARGVVHDDGGEVVVGPGVIDDAVEEEADEVGHVPLHVRPWVYT